MQLFLDPQPIPSMGEWWCIALLSDPKLHLISPHLPFFISSHLPPSSHLISSHLISPHLTSPSHFPPLPLTSLFTSLPLPHPHPPPPQPQPPHPTPPPPSSSSSSLLSLLSLSLSPSSPFPFPFPFSLFPFPACQRWPNGSRSLLSGGRASWFWRLVSWKRERGRGGVS